MTYDPNADRCYWRQQDDKRLIEAARDTGHELAIALGERLEDRTAGGQSFDTLHAELDAAHRLIAELEAELAALDNEAL